MTVFEYFLWLVLAAVLGQVAIENRRIERARRRGWHDPDPTPPHGLERPER